MRAFLAVAAAALFALVLPTPVVGEQSTQPDAEKHLLLEIVDPANDVVIEGNGQRSPALPSNEVANHADITKLRILDPDEESLVFELYAQQPFHPPPTTGGSYFHVIRHAIGFTIPGQGAAKIRAVLQVDSVIVNSLPFAVGAPDGKLRLARASVCFPAPSAEENCSIFAGLYAYARVVDGHAVVQVPKSALLRDDQQRVSSRSAALPTRLVAGDEFTDVRVRSDYAGSSDAMFLPAREPRPTDRAPDTGGASVRLVHASPTTDIRFGRTAQAVVDGEENVLFMEVTNLASNGRIINLSIEPTAASDDGPWSVSITPKVTLAAGKGTNLTIRVNPPATGADLRAYGFFRVRATVPSEPGTVALTYLRFAVEPPLDSKRNTFYVHGTTSSIFELPIPLPFFQFGSGFLSRYENDPSWRRDAPISLTGTGLIFGGTTIQRYFGSQPIPNAARFLAGEPIKSRLEFQTDFPATGTLSLMLRISDLTLGEVTRTFSFQAGKTPLEFDVPVLGDVKRIDPAQGYLLVILRLTFDAPYSLVAGSNLAPMYLLPRTSWIRLPVEREAVELPSDLRYRVALAAAEDLQGFVNPGRTTVYELDLRNEDERPLGLRVEVENATAGWTYDVRPGTRFKLDPAEAVRIGILATAPTGAAEGSLSRVRILVREAQTDEIVAAQTLQTIVATSVEIEDETFAARSEDASKLDVDVRASSPGLGLVWALAAALGIALSQRRRL